jgi:hypothetical protein
MSDFVCQIQADDLMYGEDFLAWVHWMENDQANRDETDRHWDDVNNQVNDEWADNQPKPF